MSIFMNEIITYLQYTSISAAYMYMKSLYLCVEIHSYIYTFLQYLPY